jgi:peptidoglycan/xylan/chitin deacetylase (PgdA/CDA1 family)
MLTSMKRPLAASLFFAALLPIAHAAVPVVPAAASTVEVGASAPVHEPSEARHALNRQAHLSRLYERLTVDPQELKRQCRFESDITTPPPPGLVALTFDDGPDPERTEQILEVLDHYDIPATFFFIGEKMEKYPELVSKVLAKKRHLIGSHSWSHPNFHDIGDATQQTEIERGLAQMPTDARLKIYRYPYGNSTCGGNELLHAQGYQIVGWHVDSCDWAFDRTGTVDVHEALSCGVLSQYRSDFVGHVAAAVRARRGGIVLMHEIHANTLAKLADVIEEIRRDGFIFTRLDDPLLEPSLR